jgi:hypothetical protein
VLAYLVLPAWRVVLWHGEKRRYCAWKGISRRERRLGQSPGMSGKLGNLTGQGLNIGAKKLRSAAIEMAKKIRRINNLIYGYFHRKLAFDIPFCYSLRDLNHEN